MDETVEPTATATETTRSEKRDEGDEDIVMVDVEPAERGQVQGRVALRETEQSLRLREEVHIFESEPIYFDFDESDLRTDARAILTKKAIWLRENPAFSIRIEGHCDERGTIEYNLALGDRRADAARNFLIDLGISEKRLFTTSYGEEKPADPRHTEEGWDRNRRAEFKVIK